MNGNYALANKIVSLLKNEPQQWTVSDGYLLSHPLGFNLWIDNYKVKLIKPTATEFVWWNKRFLRAAVRAFKIETGASLLAC